PMTTAPIAATDTKRSIPMTLTVRARHALITIGVPAMTAAATMTRSAMPPGAPDQRAVNEAAMSAPESAGTDQRLERALRSLIPSPRRRGAAGSSDAAEAGAGLEPMAATGSEGGRLRAVTDVLYGLDEPLNRSHRGVVVDLDAPAGEVHLHGRDAWQATDLLLDLGDT